MNRVAAMTVIRGSGACQAFYEGVVQQELRRQQELTEAAEDRANRMEKDRNRLKGLRLEQIHEQIFGRRGWISRIRKRAENIWAMVWAITAGKCWIEMGETAGLWERVDE